MQASGEARPTGELLMRVLRHNGSVEIVAPESGKAPLRFRWRNVLRVAGKSAKLAILRPVARWAGVAWLDSELRIRHFIREISPEQEREFVDWMVAHGYSDATIRAVLEYRRAHVNTWVDWGVVSKDVVTDTGVAYIVDDWDNSATDITNFNSHGYGEGSAVEAVGNTTLQTERETPRGAGTKSQPAANQLRTVQTHTFSGTFGIKEHGIFSAATGGTLWDRSVFSVINVVANDAIEATYTCTVNSGG